MISNKLFQRLVIFIPAAVCFGPLFMTRFQSPWLQTVAGLLLFLVLTNQQKRLEALEVQLNQLHNRQ